MPRLKVAMLDLIAGFAALAMLIAFAAMTDAGFDMRKLCVADGVAFFCAGLVRSRSRQFTTWLKSMFVGLPIASIILLMSATGIAFTDARVAQTIALITLGMTLAGITCGRLWLAGSRAIGFSVAVVLISVVVAGSVLLAPTIVAHSLGKTLDVSAPHFTMTRADGSVIDSAQWHGHVVVLSFWATWCAPCREELPELEKLAQRYRGEPDVEFWAVGGPWGDDTIERERRYAHTSGMTLSLAFDGNRSAARAMRINSFPSVALLDRSGHLRFVHSGYDASDPLIRHLSEKIDGLRNR